MTEEIEALRDSVTGVLADLCDRRAVHRHVDGQEALDRVLHARATELGWLGIGIGEDCGGIGAGLAGSAMVIGELARMAAPGSFLPTLAVAHVIERFCEPGLREQWLARIVSGQAGGAILARLDDGVDDGRTMLGSREGARLFVGSFDGGGQGLWRCDGETAALDIWDPTRTMWTVPGHIEKLCDLPDAAGAYLESIANVLIAADSIGLTQGIFAQTVDYLNEREQFGVRLGSFQALKHRMANVAAELAMLESVLEHAIASVEADDAEAPFWSASCKASATDAAVFATGECLQLHGGIGFTWEHDCHLFLKRARLNQALMRDNFRLRVAAFDVLAANALADEACRDVMA